MSIRMVSEQPPMFEACMKVIGVGGGGGNAVEHMIAKGTQGITFITANTDQQALNHSRADVVIPLGKTGLGAGAKPEVGAQAAEEAQDKIREALEGANLLFITAGMGGGTGTGAAPVIARIAKEMDILTIAIVTKPFDFEGTRRMRQAQAGIEKLKENVDSLIVILNDKLEGEVGEDATMLECFAAADDVLYKACNGIAEIIHTSGLINVDFEDLRTVMGERGTAMMGTATASGPNRARDAAEKAITCPLLEGAHLQGARGLLVYVTASKETLRQPEIRQVMSVMKNFVNPDAYQIVGTAFNDDMGDELLVTVVATGLDDDNRDLPPIDLPQPKFPDVLGSNAPKAADTMTPPVLSSTQWYQKVSKPTETVQPSAMPSQPPVMANVAVPTFGSAQPTAVSPSAVQAAPAEPKPEPAVQQTGDLLQGGAPFFDVPTILRNK